MNRTPETVGHDQVYNICIMEVPGEDRLKGAERILEKIMAQTFINLMNNTNLQIQEAQKTPSRINSKRAIPDTLYSNR